MGIKLMSTRWPIFSHRARVVSLSALLSALRSALLASGGNSAVILLHSLSSLDPEPEQCLIGHALNVCALVYDQTSKKLLSGSWDSTAIVWSEGEKEGEWSAEVILKGHEAAVWGVAFVQDFAHRGNFLTGESPYGCTQTNHRFRYVIHARPFAKPLLKTADLRVILWNGNGEQFAAFKGYPEPIRSLSMLSDGITFVSACNDG